MRDEICSRAQALADELFEMYTSGDPFNDGAVLGVCQRHLSEVTAPLRKRIAESEGLGPLIEDYIAEVNRLFYLEDQSGEMLDLSLKIKAILKGGAS